MSIYSQMSSFPRFRSNPKIFLSPARHAIDCCSYMILINITVLLIYGKIQLVAVKRTFCSHVNYWKRICTAKCSAEICGGILVTIVIRFISLLLLHALGDVNDHVIDHCRTDRQEWCATELHSLSPLKKTILVVTSS